MEIKKVFLGGTCGTSTWRQNLIKKLKISYYNPVVENWTKSIYERELEERQLCDYCLYVITSEIEGFYAIAEVVDDSHKRPNKTIFCYLEKGFSSYQLQSLKAIGKMIESNGGHWLKSLTEVALFLNQKINKND